MFYFKMPPSDNEIAPIYNHAPATIRALHYQPDSTLIYSSNKQNFKIYVLTFYTFSVYV